MKNNARDRFSLENQKINIFIGSSSESKKIAYAVASFFDEKKFNVKVWDKVFERNKSNLDNLKKFTAIYDYAIFVFVKEKNNKLLHRGSEFENIPANTIFEAGLFFGRLGESRTFFLAENAVGDFIDNVLSDLKGISFGKTFDNNPNKSNKKNVKKATIAIREEILESYFSTSEIRFLPSTVLAIGYYENFVVRVMKELNKKRKKKDSILTLSYGKDNPVEYKFSFYRREFKMKVVLPESLKETTHAHVEENSFNAKMDNTSIQTNSRPFGINWKIQTQKEIDREGFVFYDFPTTLLSSHEAIKLVLQNSGGVLSKKNLQTINMVGEKEIHNFLIALDYQKEKFSKPYLKDRLEIIPMSDIFK